MKSNFARDLSSAPALPNCSAPVLVNITREDGKWWLTVELYPRRKKRLRVQREGDEGSVPAKVYETRLCLLRGASRETQIPNFLVPLTGHFAPGNITFFRDTEFWQRVSVTMGEVNNAFSVFLTSPAHRSVEYGFSHWELQIFNSLIGNFFSLQKLPNGFLACR